MSKKILKGVEDYYTQKIKEFGGTPSGVDWNSKESQHLRFEQLCKIINQEKFSIIDYGCGYGELINFLLNSGYKDFEYFGYDLSLEMINKATTLFNPKEGVYFGTNIKNKKSDYVVASGIFNVMPNSVKKDEWFDYIIKTINDLNKMSIKGYSFNVLTKYSDKEYMKDYLYYADPNLLFDYCKRNHSRNVALLHDYDLYEFTILVRK